MPEIYLIKNSAGAFSPAYESDRLQARKIKSGKAIKVKYSSPRNYEFHKKYYALLNMAFENQENFISFENFRKEIIKYAGYYDEYFTLMGKKEYRAKSISFAKMDSETFDRLYKSSLQVILKYVLKGVTEQEIKENIINFM